MGTAFNNLTLWIMWLLPVLCGSYIGMIEAESVLKTSNMAYSIQAFLVLLLQYSIGLTVLAAVLTASIVALSPGDMPGILGHHQYELRPAGIFEKTDVNTEIVGWEAVRSVRRSILGAHLRVADSSVHYLPRRAFKAQSHLDEFVQMANAWRNATKRI